MIDPSKDPFIGHGVRVELEVICKWWLERSCIKEVDERDDKICKIAFFKIS